MRKGIVHLAAWGLALAALGTTATEVRAQGRGIGAQVSGAARSGIHGPQLADYVHRFQMMNGIGVANRGNAGAAAKKAGKPQKMQGGNQKPMAAAGAVLPPAPVGKPALPGINPMPPGGGNPFLPGAGQGKGKGNGKAKMK